MNTHDIELPKPFMTVYDDVDKVEVGCYSEIQVRATIEADRQRRGEPVASPAKYDDFSTQKRRIEESIRAGARLTNHRFNLDAPRPAEPVNSQREAQNYADDAYNAGWNDAKAQPAEPDAATIADYEEVLADHRRLVRELDVLLNGEEGAAKQASLCDIVAQVRREGIKTAEPVKVPSDDALDDALSNLEHDNYEQSYSGYKNRQADIALIRAALARYGQPAQPAASAAPIGYISPAAAEYLRDGKIVAVCPSIIDGGIAVYAAPVAAQPSVPDGWVDTSKWPSAEELQEIVNEEDGNYMPSISYELVLDVLRGDVLGAAPHPTSSRATTSHGWRRDDKGSS